jgi:hypothetical protein
MPIFNDTKTALQWVHSKFPMRRILVLGDIRPSGYKLSRCVSLWSRQGPPI